MFDGTNPIMRNGGSGSSIAKTPPLATREIAIEEAAETAEAAPKRRKLSKEAADNVHKLKIVEIFVGFGLIIVGVGCAVGGSFIAGDGESLKTIGSAMASGGLGLLLGPAKETAIDAIKKPVEDEATA
jgi:hypothetical protein